MQEIKHSEPKFSLTANILKLIAIFAMTIDHISFVFVPYDPPSTLGTLMHTIGMTAAPLMFYFAVEGYHHTRNVKRYLKRLAAFAVISWFPFLYFINGGIMAGSNALSYLHLNVIYTIFLGVLAIHIRWKLKNSVAKVILILLLVILSAPANWGYWGVIIIFVFDCFYGRFKKQALGYCVIVLLNVILSIGDIQYTGMFIPIILLYFYNGQRGRGGVLAKWFFYIFYPLHLLILGFIQTVL